MITRIKTINEIKPIFREYLKYMSQFFEITHYDSWSVLVFWEQVVSSYTDGKFIKKRNASFSGYGFVFNNGFKK
ncbi:MAG: hypothetical protein PF503_25810 [Desulfobacula sp.]|nr:hypothetical protein [Desulfobacula sp.]